jgi:hypothetical protein
VFFFVHNHASYTCAPFLAFLNGACAHAPYVVLVHADFIVDCIVLGLLEMYFWSMVELIDVWRCWIPVTICGRNFSDSNVFLLNTRIGDPTDHQTNKHNK